MISDIGQALVRDGIIEMPDKNTSKEDRKHLKIKKSAKWIHQQRLFPFLSVQRQGSRLH